MTQLRALTISIVLGLATAALAVASATAHEEAPSDVEVSYFTVKDGQLALSPLPPSARNPTTLVLKGVFSPRNGLELVIPVATPNPDLIVNESRGAVGWIAASMSMKYSGTTSLLYSPYGSQTWSIVEGDRSGLMTLQCKYNDPYYCDRDKIRKVFAAPFPGHEGSGKAHTHGDGTDAARPLYAEDVEWVLRYRVAPCSTTNCPLMGGIVEYAYSILVDGSTFVELGSLGERGAPPPAPVEEAASGDNATEDGNTTDDGAGNGTSSGGNSTGGNSTGGNGTSSGGQGSNGGSARADNAFQPQAYRAQPDGDAPGVSAIALFGGLLGVGLWFRRQRRDLGPSG